MKDSEKKSYIDGLSFGLKDRERTTEKYNDYKTTEFKKFLKDNHDEIKQHLLFLDDKILSRIEEKYFIFDSWNFSEKKNIRGLIVWINDFTFDENKKFIDWNTDNENKTTIQKFAIKFYLEYYNQINEIMKDALKNKVDY